jgi:hypothetical protein
LESISHLLSLSVNFSCRILSTILRHSDFEMREVKIKRWHGVAKWKWEVADEEVCGICRMPYEACCPGVKYPGDDCPPGKLIIPSLC